jgi:hypothetical protein
LPVIARSIEADERDTAIPVTHGYYQGGVFTAEVTEDTEKTRNIGENSVPVGALFNSPQGTQGKAKPGGNSGSCKSGKS